MLKAICAALTFSSTNAMYEDWSEPHIDFQDPFHHGDTFGGLSNLHPSMKIRMAQGVTEMIKDHIAQYAVSYVNTDYHLKPEGGFSAHYWPFIFDFNYENLRHHALKVDFSQFHFDYDYLFD